MKTTRQIRQIRQSTTIIVISLLAPALSLYLENNTQFTFDLSQVLIVIGCTGIIAYAILFMLQFLLRNVKYFPMFNVIMVALGLTIWFQCTFLYNFFPDLADPSPEEVNRWMWLIVAIDATLVAIPLITAVIFHRWIYENTQKLMIVALGAQCIPLALQLSNYHPSYYDFHQYSIRETSKFTFGKSENIIFVVVDAMGERIFKDMIRQYPEVKDTFRDFICFDRIYSPIPITDYAVPSMLTGVQYTDVPHGENSEDHALYLNRACRSRNSLFVNLKQSGYRCEGYPFILQTISFSPDLLDNSTERIDHSQSMNILVDNYIAKIIPFFAKYQFHDFYLSMTNKFIIPRDENLDRSDEAHDITFFRRLNQEAKIGEFAKGFKYYHLQGSHTPVITNEKLEQTFNTDVLHQLRGSMRCIDLLIAKLKVLGLYDNALIVVTGDHTEKYGKETISFVKRPHSTQEHMIYNSMPYPVKALALTVLAEKNLRDPSRSMLAKSIASDGSSIRDTSQAKVFQFKTVRAVKDFEPITPSFHNNTFELDQNILKISRTNNPGSQNRILLRFRDLDGKFAYETENAIIDDGGYDQFLCPLATIAPGRYVVEIIEKRNPPEEGTTGELIDYTAVLPMFLIVAPDGDRLVKDYPDIQMRPLAVGEEITFAPMNPYYSLTFTNDCTVDIGRLELSEKSTVSIMVPEQKNDLTLQLEIRSFSTGPMAMKVYNDNTEILKTNYTRDNNYLINIPLKDIRSNVLNLSFKLDLKYKNLSITNRNMQLVMIKLTGK